MSNNTSQPETETINASAARQRWSELLNRVFRRGTPVIIEKSGIPVAALISIDEFRLFQRWKARRDERLAILDASWKAFDDVSDDEIEAELRRGIADIRTERRKHGTVPVGTE
jgi:prevent-host-death family protein